MRFTVLIALVATLAGCAHVSRWDRERLAQLKLQVANCHGQRPELPRDWLESLPADTPFEQRLTAYKKALDRCYADRAATTLPPNEPALAVDGPGCILVAHPILGKPRVAKPTLWMIPDPGRHYVPLGKGDTPVAIAYELEVSRKVGQRSYARREKLAAPAILAATYNGVNSPALVNLSNCEILRKVLCLHKRLTHCPSFL